VVATFIRGKQRLRAHMGAFVHSARPHVVPGHALS
jgi:hypothetical protein